MLDFTAHKCWEHFCLFFSRSTSHCIKTMNLHGKRRLFGAQGTAHRCLSSCRHCLLQLQEQLHSFILNDIWHFNQFIRCSLCKTSPTRPGQGAGPLLMHNAWGRCAAQWSGLLMDQYICCAQTVFLTALGFRWPTPLLPEPFSGVSSWLVKKAACPRKDVLVQKHTSTSAVGCGGARVCQSPASLKDLK